jgi:glycosyltransferase involved in cell wall biosynthesis
MDAEARPSVMHVILKVQATNGQFNEHCLPLADRRDITVVSFLEATLPCPPSITMVAGDGSFRGGWRALRTAQRSRSHDVVHVHAPPTGVILLLALGLRPSRLANCVYTVQNSYGNYRLRDRLLHVPIFVAYPQIVFCSRAALDSMPSLLRRVSRKKAHVVPNGVDVDAIDAAIAPVSAAKTEAEDDRAGDRLHVALVGRLVPIKNMNTTLRALGRAHASVEVEIVGDGPLRGALEEVVQGCDRLRGHVTFTGLLQRSEVHRRLAAADVCISASFGEGLPVAVLEAMACATPVLLSDIEPHREIGVESPELALVPCEDVDGFAAAVDRFASLSSAQKVALGSVCRRIVLDRFSTAAMHRAYVPIYEHASSRSSNRRVGLAW